MARGAGVAAIHTLRRERQAAGLGAQSAVAAAAAEHSGQVALAGNAHAEGAVDEDFQFQVGPFPDLPDFFQTEFPGQDNPFEAEVLQPVHAVGRHDGHLRGGMQRYVRGRRAGQGSHAQVLDNKGIHAGAAPELYELQRFLALLIPYQGVQGQMDLGAAEMGEGDCIAQGILRKIGRGAPRIQGTRTEIDRVRTAVHRSLQRLHASRRGQDFRRISHSQKKTGVLFQAPDLVKCFAQEGTVVRGRLLARPWSSLGFGPGGVLPGRTAVPQDLALKKSELIRNLFFRFSSSAVRRLRRVFVFRRRVLFGRSLKRACCSGALWSGGPLRAWPLPLPSCTGQSLPDSL